MCLPKQAHCLHQLLAPQPRPSLLQSLLSAAHPILIHVALLLPPMPPLLLRPCRHHAMPPLLLLMNAFVPALRHWDCEPVADCRSLPPPGYT